VSASVANVGAKASPVTTVIPTALARPAGSKSANTQTYSVSIRPGRATSVSYFDAAGQEQEQPADLVVLGALRSAIPD